MEVGIAYQEGLKEHKKIEQNITLFIHSIKKRNC